jgi:hypothetical protein
MQVVEGFNFRLAYSDNSGNQTFEYTVWDRPWLKSREVTQVKNKIDTSRQAQQPNVPIVGAFANQDINNLPDDTKEIDSFLRGKFPELQNYKLTKAEMQVVEGANFRLAYSDNSGNQTFEYTVWDRPWLKSREVTQVKKVSSSTNSKGEKVVTTKTISQDQGQFKDALKKLFA